MPESATSISGGTMIETTPSPATMRTLISWPGRSAPRRSTRARPAIAVTAVSAAASQLPSRLVMPRMAVTRPRRRPVPAGHSRRRWRRFLCVASGEHHGIGREVTARPARGCRNRPHLGVRAIAPAEPQERGQRDDGDGDAAAEEEDLVGVLRLDQPVHERDRCDQDQHRDDSGLQVLDVVHLQPAWQPELLAFPLFGDHEQLVEAESQDHQRDPDQERVHDHEEAPEPCADVRWLADHGRSACGPGCPRRTRTTRRRRARGRSRGSGRASEKGRAVARTLAAGWTAHCRSVVPGARSPAGVRPPARPALLAPRSQGTFTHG